MRVSICHPTIHTDKRAEQALMSMEHQTHEDTEIVIDKGGPDVVYAMNRCLKKATGDLITWCYDDDVLMLEKNEILAMYAEKYPDIDVFYTGMVNITKNNKFLNLWSPPAFDKNMFEYGNVVSTIAAGVRKSAIGDITFRTDYPVCHEFVFFLDLMNKGCKFLCINIPLVFVRVNKQQYSYENHAKKLKEHEKIQEEFGKNLYSRRHYNEKFFKQ